MSRKTSVSSWRKPRSWWPIKFQQKHSTSAEHDMMKSINITTRITILILMVSLVAVASISFFSYDYHQKANEEKYSATLAALVDNRSAYLNSFLDKAAL